MALDMADIIRIAIVEARKPKLDPVSALPLELMSAIVEHLPPKDIFKLRMVSKAWYKLFSSQYFTRPALDSYNIDPIYRKTGEEEYIVANYHLGTPCHRHTFDTRVRGKRYGGLTVGHEKAVYVSKDTDDRKIHLVDLSTLHHTEYMFPKAQPRGNCFLSDTIVGVSAGSYVYWTDQVALSRCLASPWLAGPSKMGLTSTPTPATHFDAYNTNIVGLVATGTKLEGLWIFDTLSDTARTWPVYCQEQSLHCLHAGKVITVMSLRLKYDPSICVQQFSYLGERTLVKSIYCSSSQANMHSVLDALRKANFRVKSKLRQVDTNRFQIAFQMRGLMKSVLIDLSVETAVMFGDRNLLTFYKDRIYVCQRRSISSVHSNGQQAMVQWKEELDTCDLFVNDGYMVHFATKDGRLKLDVWSFRQPGRWCGGRPGNEWTWNEVHKHAKLLGLFNTMLWTYDVWLATFMDQQQRSRSWEIRNELMWMAWRVKDGHGPKKWSLYELERMQRLILLFQDVAGTTTAALACSVDSTSTSRWLLEDLRKHLLRSS